METLGIDPGKTGAIVSLDGDGAVSWSRPMPDTPQELARLLRDHVTARVIVERQFAMPEQGRSSTLTIGIGYGVILGVCAGLDIPLELVRAQDWQKVMLRGEGKAKGVDLKRQYVAVAERMWPSVTFRGPKGGMNDGKAAAALIAEYGRRLTGGNHV